MKKFDKNVQIKILKIILIIIWMITVFIFSAQKGSDSGNTSRNVTITIVKIITGNSVNENDPLLETIETIIRKLAHYTIYSIGGFLIMNYAYTTDKTKKQKILYSILLGGGYAVTDELHQFFVPERNGNIFDVGIDTAGVITGVLMYLLLRKIINIAMGKYRVK